ncbi:MAG: hypothetical protein J2P18_22440 [Nocardia sp.]|nr:hypothetical protein [Nocardia sp.]
MRVIVESAAVAAVVLGSVISASPVAVAAVPRVDIEVQSNCEMDWVGPRPQLPWTTNRKRVLLSVVNVGTEPARNVTVNYVVLAGPAHTPVGKFVKADVAPGEVDYFEVGSVMNWEIIAMDVAALVTTTSRDVNPSNNTTNEPRLCYQVVR